MAKEFNDAVKLAFEEVEGLLDGLLGDRSVPRNIKRVAQKGIDIKLPETSQAETRGPQSSSLVLVIESDLSITINREPISKEMLETRLRDLYQTDSKKPLFVKADETVSYKEVLSIIDIAKGAGVEVVGVYTDRYQTGQ